MKSKMSCLDHIHARLFVVLFLLVYVGDRRKGQKSITLKQTKAYYLVKINIISFRSVNFTVKSIKQMLFSAFYRKTFASFFLLLCPFLINRDWKLRIYHFHLDSITFSNRKSPSKVLFIFEKQFLGFFVMPCVIYHFKIIYGKKSPKDEILPILGKNHLP